MFVSVMEKFGNHWSDVRQSGRPGRVSLCVEVTEQAAKSSTQNTGTKQNKKKTNKRSLTNTKKKEKQQKNTFDLFDFEGAGPPSCGHSSL